MEYPNLISTTISNTDIKEIIAAIKFIDNKLSEMATLSHEEVDALPKMRQGTIGFVLENLEQAKEHPLLVPNDVDIEEIKKDVVLIDSIKKILDPIKKLERKLEENALLAESEAYLPSIAIHNAMRADQIRQKYRNVRVSV